MAELTVELLAEALELIDRKAAELRPEDWEWSAIGDNNLLAAETAMGLAKLLNLADDRARALRVVAREALYRRWEARYRYTTSSGVPPEPDLPDPMKAQ